MTPNDYNLLASEHIWTTAALPRTWAGKRYYPYSKEFSSAVKAYQIQALVPADGKLGPVTWSSMQRTLGKETYGLDVSKYQGIIDYVLVQAAGYEYALIKATEGQDYTDPLFRRNAIEAPAAGLRTFYYHYGTPHTIRPGQTPTQDAIAEAKDFVDALVGLPRPSLMEFTSSSKKRQCDVVLDIEKDCPSLTPAQGLEWVMAWLTAVEGDGYLAGLYTSYQWMEREVYRYEQLMYRVNGTRRPILVARYGSNSGKPEYQYSPDNKVPPAWGTYDVWQYTSEGKVPGIEGRVDLDLATLITPGGLA